MSPKKTLLLSTLAFVVLCAISLAYYLPKLRPQAEMETAQSQANPQHRSEQAPVQPPPLRPDEAKPAADPSLTTVPKALDLPAAAAEAASSAPPAKAEPDAKLLDLLKNPPIQFETGSPTLTADSRQYLDSLASKLSEQRQIKLAIEGHTDSQDRLGKNQALSEQRAQAVLQYLTQQGIAPERLSSVGYGGSRPIADNDTAAGRQKNRRIEFKISN